MTDRTCSVESCDKLLKYKELCSTHYGYFLVNSPERRRCSVDDCDRPVSSKEMCTLHGSRLRTYGSTEKPYEPTSEERFWAKVNKNGPVSAHRPDLGPCWIWIGSLNKSGYGQRRANWIADLAHRVSYEYLIGSIPEDRPELDHLCRVPACVNPAHLEPVNKRENALRGIKARFEQRGKKPLTTSKSGYRGVFLNKKNGKWIAKVKNHRKDYVLGSSFLTAEDAAKAYDKAAIEFFGEFAAVNFLSSLEEDETICLL